MLYSIAFINQKFISLSVRALKWLLKRLNVRCTRHIFINKLYSEKVDENVIKALVGHEKEFTMKHYGGETFSPERLLWDQLEEIENIKWENK